MPKQRIQKYYNNVVVEDLLIIYNYDSIMQLPCLSHATLNTTSKKYLLDKKIAIYVFAACFLLTGQKSVLTRARKSIAAFNLRDRNIIGCKVTLRKSSMYNVMSKLVTFVLPRIQNFWHKQNLLTGAKKSVLHIGINNFLLFPEIETFFSLFGGGSDFIGVHSNQGFDLIWHFSIPKIQVNISALTYSANSVYKISGIKKENQVDLKKETLNGQIILSQHTFSPIDVASLLVTAFQYPRMLP